MATQVRVEVMATKNIAVFSGENLCFVPKINGKNIFSFGVFRHYSPNTHCSFPIFLRLCKTTQNRNSVKKSEATKFGAFVFGKKVSGQKNITKRCFSGVFRQFLAEATVYSLKFSGSTRSFSARLVKKCCKKKRIFQIEKKISAKDEQKTVSWGFRTFLD